MSKYYPPQYEAKQFHCIYCNVYSKQNWFRTRFNTSAFHSTKIDISECTHCNKDTYWNNTTQKMIIPSESPIQPHHIDMPKDITTEYNEARDIFSKSPRAAAALLRLALQKLLPLLGATKGNINKDIQDLVDKGLPILVQKALDICRVVGNNGVHPGEIDLNDTPEIAQTLFEMLNFIIEDRITRPKQIEELYSNLPSGALEAIETRK